MTEIQVIWSKIEWNDVNTSIFLEIPSKCLVLKEFGFLQNDVNTIQSNYQQRR